MRKRKKNDTMGEFKRGDVIAQIDGTNRYVVTGSYQTAMWYVLIFQNKDKWYTSKLDVDYVDSKYVKIDHVGERKINEFYRRLG